MTDLGNRYGLNALKTKRAEISGEIEALKRRLVWAEASLRYLDGSLAIFDPKGDPKKIPPKRIHERAALFRHGQLGMMVVGILRKAGKPIPTALVISEVWKTVGLEEDEKPAMAVKVRGHLQYMAKIGRIKKHGERVKSLWSVRLES